MRLSPHELAGIRQVLLGAPPLGSVFLYGSRSDDAKRGGDIDVYLEASHPILLKDRLMLEMRLRELCGCKVDLLVRNPDSPMRPIFEIAREGIPL